MIFFTPFLLSASFNLDSLNISTILKSQNIKIYKYSLIFISIFTTISTFIFMYLGKFLSSALIKEYSNVFGCTLLSFIGIYYLIEHIRIQENEYGYDTSYYYETFKKYKYILIHPELLLTDESDTISFKNTIILSISLSLDNCIIGFAGGIIGIDISVTIFLNFILNIILFLIGYIFNKSCFLSKYNYIFSSVLLIFIGILTMFF